VLSIRDVLTALAEGRVQGNDSVTHLARPLYLVPGSKAVGELFGEMREEGYQMAVIVSEYGGTSGIVSIDQLVDDIVGEVKEELVPAKKAFEVVGARAYRIDGSMRIWLEHPAPIRCHRYRQGKDSSSTPVSDL